MQHSAGSGKSNTIAWLAHALSSLHTPTPRGARRAALAKGYEPNQPVFDKVIVITDRVVLDRQLQDTVYQFEHTPGVVERIDQDSSQLADALQGDSRADHHHHAAEVPGTSLRARCDAACAGKRFAVIVDEAHSSQSGERGRPTLKQVLRRLGRVDDVATSDGDLLHRQSALGPRPAARTCRTSRSPPRPKPKTLELFGELTRRRRQAGVPFHTYSMRQAIEEGFILDVLRNYIDVQDVLAGSPAPSPTTARSTGARRQRAARPVRRRCTRRTWTQQAEIIVEHFREHTARQIGGRAKAMVVTALAGARAYDSTRRSATTLGSTT